MTRAALLVVHAEANHLARRRRERAFLPVRTVAGGGIGEHAVERELLLCDRERRRLGRGSRGERPDAEAVDEAVREERGRGSKRQRVHHEHELPRPLGTRERVDVGDVRDRVGERPRP